MILILDMDEILTDFIGAACKVHGLTRAQMEHYRPPGQWDVSAAMGLAKTAGMSAFTLDEFWEPIHKGGQEFWESIEKYHWFDEVIAWADSHFDNWFIASAPSREPNSYTGKVNWLKREFGSDFDRFFLTPHKEMLAHPNRVLLDDKESNLEAFSNNGGDTILFPSKGNRLHRSSSHPMTIITY